MYAYDFNRVPGPSSDEIRGGGGDGVLTYGTGNKQPQSYIDSIESAGLHVARIWEHNTDSILGGYDYGVSECRAFEANNPPGLVYLACDLNDGALGSRSVVPFCNGWCDTTREATVGLYGPDHAILDGQAMRRPKLSKWWGVVNWLDGGYPDNDPRNIARWSAMGVHLVQLIGSPIPDTDQNLVLDPLWWSTGATPAPAEEDEMIHYITRKSNPSVGIWATNDIHRRHVGGEEWKFINDMAQLAGNPPPTVLGVTDEWWGTLLTGDVAGSGGTFPTELSVAGTFTGTAKV